MYLFTNSIKMLVNIMVWKPKYEQIILLQDCTSFCIGCFALFGIVLGAIQFNDEPGIGTVKIYNKRFNDPLLIDFNWIIP